MKLDSTRKVVTFRTSPDDGTLTVRYANQGDPYSQGIQLELSNGWGGDLQATVYLETWEMRALRDLLNKLLPVLDLTDATNDALNKIADSIAAGAIVEASEDAAEKAAQLIRDLLPLRTAAEAYVAAQENAAAWKKEALEAQQEIRELPTVEMVVLQAQKYANAIPEMKDSELADLKHMLAPLPSDTK
jgi:hypothetical protein